MHKFSVVQDAKGHASIRINDKDVPGVLIQGVRVEISSEDKLPKVTLTSVVPSIEIFLKEAEISLVRPDTKVVDHVAKTLAELPLKVPEPKSDIFSRTSPDFGGFVGKDGLLIAQTLSDGYVPTPWRTTGYGGSLVDTAGWHFGYQQEIRQWVRPGTETKFYEGGRIRYNAGFCGDWLFKDVEVPVPAGEITERYFTGAQAFASPESAAKWKSPVILQFAEDLVTLYQNVKGDARYPGKTIPKGFEVGRFGELFMAALLKR